MVVPPKIIHRQVTSTLIILKSSRYDEDYDINSNLQLDKTNALDKTIPNSLNNNNRIVLL